MKKIITLIFLMITSTNIYSQDFQTLGSPNRRKISGGYYCNVNSNKVIVITKDSLMARDIEMKCPTEIKKFRKHGKKFRIVLISHCHNSQDIISKYSFKNW